MKPRVKLKLRGIRQVLRSDAVQADLAKRARRGAQAAGPGIVAVVKPHKYTARAFVETENEEGRIREAKDKVLNRALGAMR